MTFLLSFSTRKILVIGWIYDTAQASTSHLVSHIHANGEVNTLNSNGENQNPITNSLKKMSSVSDQNHMQNTGHERPTLLSDFQKSQSSETQNSQQGAFSHQKKSPIRPSSFIDLDVVRPNPASKINIKYCRNDVACSPRSQKTRVCPGISQTDNVEYYSLLADPNHDQNCVNPDYDAWDAAKNGFAVAGSYTEQPPQLFQGFQMYNIQVVAKCGIHMSLFSRSFPIPKSAANIPTSAWRFAEWFRGGTLADAGAVPVNNALATNITLDVRDGLKHVTRLPGNVMANSLTGDIGDARIFNTTVWPLDMDDSFYFTFEPMLPHSTSVWKIKYDCASEKKMKVKAAYNIVSNPRNGYASGDIEYYRQLMLLCENTHYWCVEEDQSSGVNRFYLCPSLTLAGTFQIEFSSTSATEIYVERGSMASMNSASSAGDYDCIALFSNNQAEPANDLRLGDIPVYERWIYYLWRYGWSYAVLGIIICLFAGYVKYKLHPNDENLDELSQRRRFWLSHPAHQSMRWNGGDNGLSSLWDKRDLNPRYT